MARYGFGEADAEIKGGTEVMHGDGVFDRINTNLIISELTRMPPLAGSVEPAQIWDDAVVWGGNNPGAIKVAITPLGSLKLVVRRLVKDLQGENTWVFRKVLPMRDDQDQYQENVIAGNVYDCVVEVNQQPLEAPDAEYEDLDRLAHKLWHTTKKQHPSYIMFPTSFRRQAENYYKLVYEIRGQGAGSPYQGKTGRTEQFNIDLVYEPKSGMIRSIGYDIDSSMRQHTWQIQTPEWDEKFSPRQDPDEIVKNIVVTFLQY